MIAALVALAIAIDFSIDLDSTGGFHGRGSGALLISSDGWMAASRMGGVIREPSPARVQLTREEIDSLQSAVATAIRHPWPRTNSTAADNGCCDRYKWTLRLQQRDADRTVREFVTSWYDGQQASMPPELAALTKLIARLRERALAARGGKP